MYLNLIRNFNSSILVTDIVQKNFEFGRIYYNIFILISYHIDMYTLEYDI